MRFKRLYDADCTSIMALAFGTRRVTDEQLLAHPSLLLWEFDVPGADQLDEYRETREDAIAFVRAWMQRHKISPQHLFFEPSHFGPEMAARLEEKKPIIHRIRAIIVNFKMMPGEMKWPAMTLAEVNRPRTSSKASGKRKPKRRR